MRLDDEMYNEWEANPNRLARCKHWKEVYGNDHPCNFWSIPMLLDRSLLSDDWEWVEETNSERESQ